jgi:hypothetical protein
VPLCPGIYSRVDAVTSSNWEGKGVQPDVGTVADKSFAAAYSVALHGVGRQTPVSADSADMVTEARLLELPNVTPGPAN